jgi:hypothetical protein
LRLFPDCQVGAEKIGDEAGSDMLSEVVSTAAAVGVSAGQGGASGLPGPVRGALASLRGFTMALWVMMRATIVSSKTGAALTAFALAIGGALIALAILAPDPPSIVVALGAALVAAGFAAAFIRAGSMRATLIVLVGLLVATLPLLLGLVAGWVEDSKGEWWADALLWVKAHRDDLTPVFLVVGLAAGSMLLGIVRKKPARPKQ